MHVLLGGSDYAYTVRNSTRQQLISDIENGRNVVCENAAGEAVVVNTSVVPIIEVAERQAEPTW